MDHTYAGPAAGLPPQSALMTGRAVFTEAYAVLPAATMSDITVSLFPGWSGTRGWILARPMTGFAETFAQYAMELEPGGGSDAPEPDPLAEAGLFVTEGTIALTVNDTAYDLGAGSYGYVPPGHAWRLWNASTERARFQWIRKRHQRVEGQDLPNPIIARDSEIQPSVFPDTAGRWATTRFHDPDDIRHDMHVNVVTLQPGGVIPFEETHVMEHGLYVLQGKGVYKLNRDWVEVEAGDFMWLRAFCPQACYAGGPEPFRYLLYKDVNRHPALVPGQ